STLSSPTPQRAMTLSRGHAWISAALYSSVDPMIASNSASHGASRSAAIGPAAGEFTTSNPAATSAARASSPLSQNARAVTTTRLRAICVFHLAAPLAGRVRLPHLFKPRDRDQKPSAPARPPAP